MRLGGLRQPARVSRQSVRARPCHSWHSGCGDGGKRVVKEADPSVSAEGKEKVGDQGKPQLVFERFPGLFVFILVCLTPQTHTPTHPHT